MIIVHICLACFYVDGMGYQENLLPKYHNKEYDVTIITSDFTFDSTGKKQKREKAEYVNEYDIPVKVLKKSKRYGWYSKYKDFEGVYDTLNEISPDIIFCHGGQFVALKDVLRYCRRHKHVRLYIDQHGDYYNTPVNTLSRRMGQYLIYGHWMRRAAARVEKYWGVTPWRCQYLHDVYKIPKDKIDFLPMGGDDEKIHFVQKEEIRCKIREMNNIKQDDFLIITGGKIDKTKNIDLLIQAVVNINNEKVKLLVFGQPNEVMKNKFENLVQNECIRYIGWISSEKVYDYFLASDLAVFPGTHSVLWEQACACGLPGVFRKWPGMEHVDVGGNALFLHKDSVEEIEQILREIIDSPSEYERMSHIAKTKGINTFSYSEIAKRAISE